MTTQIAVKLPDDLVSRIDTLVARGDFPSRSAAVREGLEAILAGGRRKAIDDAFEQGFAAIPETKSELRESARLAREAINEEPWEKWW